MAMADRRPLGIPVTSTHALPAYNANSSMKSTISDLKGTYSENDITSFNSDKSLSPTELSPTLRSISPDSLMNSAQGSVKKSTSSVSSRDSTPPGNTQLSSFNYFPKATITGLMMGKKPKISTRVPIATGISTTIPVTGEKPKPEQEGDASLEDDVLYAIFLILYEKDAAGAGMTVKQICDVLIERHPDMAQLLSKTSNLVSAKLNAYVKRVEKGDSNLKYALSREWADALPKRMVYVYRGLLAKDFYVHVKNAMDVQKQQTTLKFTPLNLTFATGSFEAAKQSALLKQRRQTMFDLGLNRPTFLESPIDRSNLFVPYLSAPVAASFTSSSESAPATKTDENDTDATSAAPTPTTTSVKRLANDLDFDFDDLEVFNDTDDDSGDLLMDSLAKNGKRSKSMSYLSVSKKAKFLTAAAAAPRAPKTPCSHSPNAAAAAAALHAAALKAISETSTSTGSNSSSASTSPKLHRNWATVVRSGFLTQEIAAPEDLNLSDLDKLFG